MHACPVLRFACDHAQVPSRYQHYASANMPHAGITMHVLKCEHIQTRPFIWASLLSLLDRVCDLQSHLLLFFAFTKLLLNHQDCTGNDHGMGELL